MRTIRLIAAVAGLVVALLAIGTTATSAVELPCKEVEGKHRVCATGKEIGDTNKFVAYGKVTTYKGRIIKLQRRACGTCAWKFYKETRTSEETGWFRTRIYPGKVGSKVCYRVVVPKTNKYELTRVVVGCIRTESA